MHIVQLTSSQVHVLQEFIETLNVNECNEVAKIYDLNLTNDDDLLSFSYHAQRSRIEGDVKELAEFFEEIEGRDYFL